MSSSAKSSMPTPLHLLRPDETHTSLVCIPEAMAALREIKGPVKVCSLVGTQRQGKSSLLNLLHKRSCVPPGFGIGHYMDPKTHGLHFWSKPHPRRDDVTIIYLDTEGLDAPHVDQFYNWTLSAVSLLISDVYMYQSKGSIDTGSIDRLAMILRVAEQLRGDAGIRKRSRGGRKNDNSDEGKSEWQKTGSNSDTGSSFLWLLRDHQLTMKYSPKEEMIEKLDSDALKTIRRCFDDYDCVPLPVPVNGGSSELQDMEKKNLQDLANEFREEFLVLERRILDKLRQPRILAGQEVTGPLLADLLEAYTASVQKKDGAMADIAALPTQREMLVSLAGDRAVKAGIQHYKDTMREMENITVGHKELMNKHTSVLKESIQIFDNIAEDVLDVDEVGKFRHTMIEKIVGWGKTLSTECSNDDDNNNNNKQDILIERSKLKDACLFGPIWSSNQKRLRERCSKTLDDIYSPVRSTLYKRLGVSDDDDDGLSVGRKDSKEGGNDATTTGKATLPTLAKFMAAVAKVRTKYSQHEYVSTAPVSVSTSILNDFELNCITPDTMLLMQGLFEEKTNMAINALNSSITLKINEEMKMIKEENEKKITELKSNMDKKFNDSTKHTDDSISSMEIKINNTMNTVNEATQKSIDEESKKRNDYIDRTDKKLIVMDENTNNIRTSFNNAIDVTNKEIKSIKDTINESIDTVEKRINSNIMIQINNLTNSIVQVENEQVNQRNEMNTTLNNDKTKLMNQLNEYNEKMTNIQTENEKKTMSVQNQLKKDINDMSNNITQQAQNTAKERNELATNVNTKLLELKKELHDQLKEFKKETTNCTSSFEDRLSKVSIHLESKHKESIDCITDALEEYGTIREIKKLNQQSISKIDQLKEFVRKELADHSEGMAMTHTLVEELELKISSKQKENINAIERDIDVLKENHETSMKMNSDLKKAIKNSLDKTNKNVLINKDKIILLEKDLLNKITSEEVNNMKIGLNDELKLNVDNINNNINDIQIKLNNNAQVLENKLKTNSEETDQHIKAFRASLTDEIAQALSSCNTRLAAAEKATKEMTESSSALTMNNLNEIKENIHVQIENLNNQLVDIKKMTNNDQVTMDDIKTACSTLRNELIRRDELLESQLVDAHAQMTREAQLIVAPAKSQVENMRQQVNSLNERLALATESQGKKHLALNDELKADIMLKINLLTTKLNGIVEERECKRKRAFFHIFST